MFKISATFAAAIAMVAVGTFASNAEARGGSWYAQPFFRNQGRQPAQSYDTEPSSRDIDLAREKQRARAREAAREAAAEAAEAKQAAAAAAAKRARIAAQRQEAAKLVATQAAATDAAPAKKGDRLPTSSESNATTDRKAASATTTAATETTASVSETSASTAPTVCRKYSAATAGLVETPCP